VLCRERGERLDWQARARAERPYGGDELPVGRGRRGRSPGPHRGGHRAHRHAGRRSPGCRGAIGAIGGGGGRPELGGPVGGGAVPVSQRLANPGSLGPRGRSATPDGPGVVCACCRVTVMAWAEAQAPRVAAAGPAEFARDRAVPGLPVRLGADPGPVVSRLVVAGNSVTVPAGQRASRTGMAISVSERAGPAWRCDGPPGPGAAGRPAGRPARPRRRPPPVASVPPGRR
jgi:hypothetical protein